MKINRSFALALLLVTIVIGTSIQVYLKNKRSNLFQKCLIVSSQQVTTDTSAEDMNKITFDFEISNLCQDKQRVQDIVIITRDKSTDTIIDTARNIKLNNEIEPMSKKTFDHTLQVSEEEFKKRYSYTLEI